MADIDDKSDVRLKGYYVVGRASSSKYGGNRAMQSTFPGVGHTKWTANLRYSTELSPDSFMCSRHSECEELLLRSAFQQPTRLCADAAKVRFSPDVDVLADLTGYRARGRFGLA